MNLNVAYLLIYFTCGLLSAAETLQTFSIKEYLDHNWKNALVTVDLNKNGNEKSIQVSGKTVSFLVDLSPKAVHRYKLVNKKSTLKTESSFKRTDTKATISIENGLIGIRVPTTSGVYARGPIAGIKLRSGKWAGESRLRTKRTIK